MARMRTTNTATTPPIMAAVLSDGELLSLVSPVSELGTVTTVGVGSVVMFVLGRSVGKHSSSLRDDIATEQSLSTDNRTPVTMILGLPLTQSSMKEISETLAVSEVPFSVAR